MALVINGPAFQGFYYSWSRKQRDNYKDDKTKFHPNVVVLVFVGSKILRNSEENVYNAARIVK